MTNDLYSVQIFPFYCSTRKYSKVKEIGSRVFPSEKLFTFDWKVLSLTNETTLSTSRKHCHCHRHHHLSEMDCHLFFLVDEDVRSVDCSIILQRGLVVVEFDRNRVFVDSQSEVLGSWIHSKHLFDQESQFPYR